MPLSSEVTSSSHWFIPIPEDVGSQRALLHLQLNRANRYYRELAVPGIAGVWFVRQLSWAVAGLAIARQIGRRPSLVANALEALACKHSWDPSDDDPNTRIRGKRAFKRHPEAWSFAELSQPRCYVQITFRQGTVGALADEAGLAFAQGSRLFNAMELSQHGRELADRFLGQTAGQGGGQLRAALVDWVLGNRELASNERSIGAALGPWRLEADGGSRDAEGDIVLQRLLAASHDSGIGVDPQRRYRLLQAFERLHGLTRATEPKLDQVFVELRRLGGEPQVAQLETAACFDALLMTGRRLVHETATALDRAGLHQQPISEAAENVRESLDRLRDEASAFHKSLQVSGATHHDAERFSTVIERVPPADRLAEVIRRDRRILELRDGLKVGRGPLFASYHEATLEDPDDPTQAHGARLEARGLKLTRLRQLLALWKDCHVG